MLFLLCLSGTMLLFPVQHWAVPKGKLLDTWTFYNQFNNWFNSAGFSQIARVSDYIDTNIVTHACISLKTEMVKMLVSQRFWTI